MDKPWFQHQKESGKVLSFIKIFSHHLRHCFVLPNWGTFWISIQNRVIRIHSVVCSSDDDVECMHRTADAYSRIGACYNHWNHRAGISMKYDNSGITLDGLKDSNQNRAEIGQHTKGTTQEICGVDIDSAASNQRTIQTAYCYRTGDLLATSPTTTRTAITKHTAAIPGHPPVIDCHPTSVEWKSDTRPNHICIARSTFYDCIPHSIQSVSSQTLQFIWPGRGQSILSLSSTWSYELQCLWTH